MDELLKSFKKIFPDKREKEYFYYRRNFKHPFIEGAHVIVDENTITLYGKEPVNKVGKIQNGTGDEYIITFKRKSEKNLKDILDFLFNKQH